MTGTSLQFHATNAEIVAMATGWAREFSLHAALGMLFGDHVLTVEDGDFTGALQAVPEPDFVILGVRPLHLPEGADLHRLTSVNSDILVLQPGAQRENGLSESVMAGVGDDPQAVRLWRRLVDRARRSMRSGAVLTDPSRGLLARYPGHRFTDGALRLQESGVGMRGPAGNQLYRLTTDPTPQALPDGDMVALATISHAVQHWIQDAVLPSELVDSLKEELTRRKVVTRADTAGEVAATIFDVSCRLHGAFAREDRPVPPSPRVTTYFLHLPTAQQAAAAGAGCRALGAAVDEDFPAPDGSGPSRALGWRLNVTLPGLAPDPRHSRNEEDLTGIAREHDGAYAGWQRPDGRC